MSKGPDFHKLRTTITAADAKQRHPTTWRQEVVDLCFQSTGRTGTDFRRRFIKTSVPLGRIQTSVNSPCFFTQRFRDDERF